MKLPAANAVKSDYTACFCCFWLEGEKDMRMMLLSNVYKRYHFNMKIITTSRDFINTPTMHLSLLYPFLNSFPCVFLALMRMKSCSLQIQRVKRRAKIKRRCAKWNGQETRYVYHRCAWDLDWESVSHRRKWDDVMHVTYCVFFHFAAVLCYVQFKWLRRMNLNQSLYSSTVQWRSTLE